VHFKNTKNIVASCSQICFNVVTVYTAEVHINFIISYTVTKSGGWAEV